MPPAHQNLWFYDYGATAWGGGKCVCVGSEIDFIEQSDVLVLCISFDRTNEPSVLLVVHMRLLLIGPFARFWYGSPTEPDVWLQCEQVPIFASIQMAASKWKTIVNVFDATQFYASSIVQFTLDRYHYFAFIFIFFHSLYHSHQFTLFYDLKSLFVCAHCRWQKKKWQCQRQRRRAWQQR